MPPLSTPAPSWAATQTTFSSSTGKSNDEATNESSLLSSSSVSPATSSQGKSGDLHVRYKLSSPTFKTLSAIKRSPTRRDVLELACQATEFRSFPMKSTEKAFFREINDHTGIPYPVPESAKTGVLGQPWHKVFLLVQADLLRSTGGGWPNKISATGRKDLFRESGRIYPLLERVLKCMIDVMGERLDGRGVTVGLDVLRSVSAKMWEGADCELLQIQGIGPAKVQKLAEAGVKNVKQLRKLEFFHIERLLSRNPPYGHSILRQMSGFPMLKLSVKVIGRYDPSSATAVAHDVDVDNNICTAKTRDASSTEAGSGDAEPAPCSDRGVESFLHTIKYQLWIVRVVLGYENENLPTWCMRNPWTTFVIESEGNKTSTSSNSNSEANGHDEHGHGRLVWFWRGSVKRLTGGKEMVIGLDATKGEAMKATFACEGIVGTTIRFTFNI